MTSEERLEQCRRCDYFKATTLSCGTFIVGDDVEHNGKTIRLCGCFMPVKVKFGFAKCPAEKWTNEHTHKHTHTTKQ